MVLTIVSLGETPEGTMSGLLNESRAKRRLRCPTVNDDLQRPK
jgi:hypothetical protein